MEGGPETHGSPGKLAVVEDGAATHCGLEIFCCALPYSADRMSSFPLQTVPLDNPDSSEVVVHLIPNLYTGEEGWTTG